MAGVTPFLSSEGSVIELWTAVCWVLVLVVGLGSATGIACVIGLIWTDLHPR
jgi:hypothetical protein